MRSWGQSRVKREGLLSWFISKYDLWPAICDWSVTFASVSIFTRTSWFGGDGVKGGDRSCPDARCMSVSTNEVSRSSILTPLTWAIVIPLLFRALASWSRMPVRVPRISALSSLIFWSSFRLVWHSCLVSWYGRVTKVVNVSVNIDKVLMALCRGEDDCCDGVTEWYESGTVCEWFRRWGNNAVVNAFGRSELSEGNRLRRDDGVKMEGVRGIFRIRRDRMMVSARWTIRAGNARIRVSISSIDETFPSITHIVRDSTPRCFESVRRLPTTQPRPQPRWLRKGTCPKSVHRGLPLSYRQ